MRRVVVESPLRAADDAGRERTRQYARACCRSCLIDHGEAPFASHLLYDQPGLLDDRVSAERELGILAGLSFVQDADATVVYVDLGMSDGMRRGIRAAEDAGRPIEYRTLGDGWKGNTP